MQKYKNKVAIITGGASGIGKEMARLLAQGGANVIIADCNEPLAQETASSIRAEGGQASASFLDVVDQAAFQQLVTQTYQEQGRLDYLFNNAGVVVVGPVADTACEEFNRMIDVNVRGVVHGTLAAYPIMIEQGYGHIINTSSVAGLIPCPGLVAYAASKHAVVGLSTGLRAEAKIFGVNVSVACPGFIETPFITNAKFISTNHDLVRENLPIKFYPVTDCARDIIAGVDKNKAVIVVSGHGKVLDRINRFVPALMHRLTYRFSKRQHRVRTQAAATTTTSASQS